MNTAVGAKTNWGKSYVAQGYTERNAPEVDRVIMVDYKDEFSGLVESGLLQRLTIPPGATNLSVDDWHRILDESESLQLARSGCTDEQWRVAIAPLLVALSQRDETIFLVNDEAHRLAPQRGSYPEAYDTLATTWHGDGMVVVWVTQRWAKLDEDIVSQCQSSLLGGFRSTNDLAKIESVEYPVEVHQSSGSRVDYPLPEQLLVDGEPLTLRRFTDDAGHTIGSEWIYSDDTTLKRVDSRDWEMEANHYGSDRKRIKHPFD
ncbi:hypothetical protein [Halostella sp. PRR32]|uniref:hypothetical protein n=1 Tax=Halostella sp. PRR32 TaxID=3098147 RepID=UPI002B1E2739|nr:hypothetical protein [Halostella sp. PRR32]